MSKPRLEWKVGLFVLIALAMVAGLILKFSKSATLFQETYQLNLTTSNVGGIQEGASVLMAGVRVGHISRVTLNEDGLTVTMSARIRKGNRIYSSALFLIDQAGFLGDSFVAVVPQDNTGGILQDGDTVECQEPFNIQEVARSGAGLLRQFEQTAQRLDEVVTRMDETLLTEETVTNVTEIVRNFRLLSERALGTLRGVDALIQTNVHPLTMTVSNMVVFSDQLNEVAAELQIILATNRVDITAAINNVQFATESVKKLLARLESGEGMAGSLIIDQQVKSEFNSTVQNLSLLSSNLNRFGLLWKPRPANRPSLPNDLYPGKRF